MMNGTYRLAATAAFGLEAIVKQECEALGFQKISVADGHVTFDGDERTLALANIALRSADRILLTLAEGEVDSFEALFQFIDRIDWVRLLSERAKFPVRAKSYRSTLASLSDIQRIVKKAIVKQLQREYNREWLPEDGETVPIDVSIRRDRVIVSLDTTGEGLFKRGYRAEKGGAPLKETLAHALVALSCWTPDRPLVDPFCGSGTILIEAALKARGVDPGTDRRFLAMDWPWIGEDCFRQVRRSRMKLTTFDQPLDIKGFDIDPKMIRIARQNAQKAGVGEDIRFYCVPMEALNLKENFGVLITNPPYGARLNEMAEVERLMRIFGQRFMGMRTWSHYILTAVRALDELVGRTADRRRKLFNGGMETTYYQYHGPNPNQFR